MDNWRFEFAKSVSNSKEVPAELGISRFGNSSLGFLTALTNCILLHVCWGRNIPSSVGGLSKTSFTSIFWITTLLEVYQIVLET